MNWSQKDQYYAFKKQIFWIFISCWLIRASFSKCLHLRHLVSKENVFGNIFLALTLIFLIYPCLTFPFLFISQCLSHTAVSLSVWAEGQSSTAGQLHCSLLWLCLLWLCLFCCYRKGMLWLSRYCNVWLLPTRDSSHTTFLWGRGFH